MLRKSLGTSIFELDIYQSICDLLFLNSFLEQGIVMALQPKVVFLFPGGGWGGGACWNTLLLRVTALLYQREILANKYPCVYSLLQKALIIFSKLRGAQEL